MRVEGTFCVCHSERGSANYDEPITSTWSSRSKRVWIARASAVRDFPAPGGPSSSSTLPIGRPAFRSSAAGERRASRAEQPVENLVGLVTRRRRDAADCDAIMRRSQQCISSFRPFPTRHAAQGRAFVLVPGTAHPLWLLQKGARTRLERVQARTSQGPRHAPAHRLHPQHLVPSRALVDRSWKGRVASSNYSPCHLRRGRCAHEQLLSVGEPSAPVVSRSHTIRSRLNDSRRSNRTMRSQR